MWEYFGLATGQEPGISKKWHTSWTREVLVDLESGISVSGSISVSGNISDLDFCVRVKYLGI